MDVTDGTEERFKLGIERFLTGADPSLVYYRVVLYKDRDGSLYIESFSDFWWAENSTPEEAASKIERSKEVFKALCSRSPELAAAVGPMKKKYVFVDNSNEITLAWLEEDQLVWRGLK